MTPSSHQTVRLSAGKHRSPEDGVCVVELASMLAGETFTDRPPSVCPVIGAFLRAYNDGTTEERRQDLYECASLIVGSRADRGAEHQRAELLRAATDTGQGFRIGRRLSRLLAPADEAAGTRAARALLAEGEAGHRRALALVRELVERGLVSRGPADYLPGRRTRDRNGSEDSAAAPHTAHTPA